jgi:inosine/xanthosine triphosphatase
MRIAVGVASTNTAKLAAVHSSFRRMRVRCRLIAKSTPSGVAPQPLSENETIQGAVNRATTLMSGGGYDLAVAFEGGVDRTLWGTFACEWCAVVDRDGTLGLGGGTKVLLPDRIAYRLFAGEDLGAIADDLFSTTGSGARSGIFGLLTQDLTTRSTVHETALFLALARFMSASTYDPNSITAQRLGSMLAAAIRPKLTRYIDSPTVPSRQQPVQLSLLHS